MRLNIILLTIRQTLLDVIIFFVVSVVLAGLFRGFDIRGGALLSGLQDVFWRFAYLQVIAQFFFLVIGFNIFKSGWLIVISSSLLGAVAASIFIYKDISKIISFFAFSAGSGQLGVGVVEIISAVLAYWILSVVLRW